MNNFNSWLPILNSLGIIIFAVSVYYNNRKSGADRVENQVMANFRILDDQQKGIIKDQTEDLAGMKVRLSQLEKDLSELKGKIDAKDVQIKNLNEIIANRNPELLSVLNEIKNFMSQLNGKMKDSKGVLDYQTGMIEKQAKREKAVDKATDEEDGNVLRKPLPINY